MYCSSSYKMIKILFGKAPTQMNVPIKRCFQVTNWTEEDRSTGRVVKQQQSA